MSLTPLTLIVLLPFAGSLCAALLPSNARNAAVWLAGAVAVACTILVALIIRRWLTAE